jgi:hypothetical protein
MWEVFSTSVILWFRVLRYLVLRMVVSGFVPVETAIDG